MLNASSHNCVVVEGRLLLFAYKFVKAVAVSASRNSRFRRATLSVDTDKFRKLFSSAKAPNLYS